MSFAVRFALGLSVSLLVCLDRTSAADAAKANPPRLKRADSFLGIHFDFHAGPDCTEIGKNTTPAMVEQIIQQVKPDFLQIDCKGHRGLSSYPTKVGNPAPGFVGDSLRTWREVTARHGVALYMHYSGVLDQEAVAKHPEWSAIGANGKPVARATSVFGPYADKLLIPQLKELIDVYGVDGIWADGECWGAAVDYSDRAQQLFRQATGLTSIPRKLDDPNWHQYLDFNREGFRKYLRHWVDAVHAHNPKFQIASNWAFSDHMPEPVSANVDFLSGDYSLQNSVNSARFSARCLAPQGKPWDLMAWAFSGKHSEPGRSLKSIPQLQREAAVVLAQGGGFQAYFKQKRDGSIYDWQMRLMAETARFCRDRQAICHRSQSVPQIALLYSRAAHYRQCPRMFVPASPGVTALRGVLQSLIDAQCCVDIRSEHHLLGKMADYPLIVVPEWDYLEEPFRYELVNYVRGGGNLLLIGPAAAKLFEKELDVTLQGKVDSDLPLFLAHNGWLAGLKTFHQNVKLGQRAKPFGKLHGDDDPRSASQPAASVAKFGQGRIAAVYTNLGERYLNARTSVARDFLGALVRELFPQPMVEVRGSHDVEVVLARNHGKLLVNLINAAGPHAETTMVVFDEIPKLGPIDVSLRIKNRPERITLEPGAQKLAFRYADGQAKLTLPALDIHAVLVVE